MAAFNKRWHFFSLGIAAMAGISLLLGAVLTYGAERAVAQSGVCVRDLTFPRTVSDSFTSGCQNHNYRFNLEKRSKVQISIRSDVADVYVVLRRDGTTGQVLYDYNSFFGNPPRLIRNLAAGTYAIEVTTTSATTTGNFTVYVSKDRATDIDLAPVNPRGPIPAVLADSDGNTYEVFTPEEGGEIIGENYSFIAVPGDVPSAYIVGVRMSKGDEASNAGMTHHRYTLAGNYYTIDAVDENGKTPSPGFRFRNPPLVCLPIPQHFFANIDSMTVIATDSGGLTQTVLNSGTRVQDTGLKLCAFVGTVPTILAVGLEGAPDPLPPTPEVVVEVRVAELPVTGGSAPSRNLATLLLILGLTIIAGVMWYAKSLRPGAR